MSADVVIVGAGVIGAATAFHLSLLGAGDVLVLDRATVGSGMSCRSSALVRMHYTSWASRSRQRSARGSPG
jgi:sarcosine oxidase, subunit beta